MARLAVRTGQLPAAGPALLDRYATSQDPVVRAAAREAGRVAGRVQGIQPSPPPGPPDWTLTGLDGLVVGALQAGATPYLPPSFRRPGSAPSPALALSLQPYNQLSSSTETQRTASPAPVPAPAPGLWTAQGRQERAVVGEVELPPPPPELPPLPSLETVLAGDWD